MIEKARARWAVALFLASAWGLLLRGSVSPEYDFGPAATVTVSVTSTPQGPTSPSPSPSSDDGTPGNPTPGATAGTGTGTGVGVGTGSGTGHGADGSGPFSIAGNLGAVLEPGVTAPIDLTITNPNDRPIRITGLSISIASITAPRATPTLPCAAADFSVGQPLVGTTLIIPAHSSRSLLALGVASSQWPSLGMLNAADNQDGCKGATLVLSYGGTAVWGDL
jgi:hypothetical protein